jgi:hypothetical protein
MQKLYVSSILPNLVNHLKSVNINPQNQDIQSLVDVFKWANHIPSHLYSPIFTEFFENWQNILWVWLKSEGANLDEITSWYTAWKQLFHTYNLENMTSCKENFRVALDMMNQGIKPQRKYIPSLKPTETQHKPIFEEMRFIDLVESLCAESNIEFSPLNKRHSSGKELYRMGRLQVYIDDGVLYCLVDGQYQFMSVDDAISKCQ